jgi:hypothetical protein
MAWINMIHEEEADGELADLYKKYRSRELNYPGKKGK